MKSASLVSTFQKPTPEHLFGNIWLSDKNKDSGEEGNYIRNSWGDKRIQATKHQKLHISLLSWMTL